MGQSEKNLPKLEQESKQKLGVAVAGFCHPLFHASGFKFHAYCLPNPAQKQSGAEENPRTS